MGELLELFIVFFKLGAFTIGGGIAMLPLLQHSLTEEKKWFDKDEFIDIIAVCQSLPGVVAINMATFVGYKKKGLAGSVVSTFGVVLPSFVMILLIATFISSMGDNVFLNGAMAGLRAAALGLIAVSLIQLSSAVFKNVWTVAAALLSFVLIAVAGINTAYVILLFLLLGVAAAFIGGKDARKAASSTVSSEKETDLPQAGYENAGCSADKDCAADKSGESDAAELSSQSADEGGQKADEGCCDGNGGEGR